MQMPSPAAMFTRLTGSQRATISVAALMFVGIAAWRLADPSPLGAIGFLYVIPVALLAVTRGASGGVAGVFIATALTALWDTLEPEISLTIENYFVRTVTFLTVALIVGWQVDRGKSLETEAQRWFEISDEMCCVANHEGRFTRVNSAWTRTLGYTEEELLSIPYVDLVHPDDLEATIAEASDLADGTATTHFENRYKAKDGTWRWLYWSSSADENAVYASARDITERKEAEILMGKMALQDTLTGLPNRRSWDDRVREEMVRAERSGTPMCIAILDLDRLKTVNDTQGHEAGDRLLRAAAAGWTSALRDGDLVARLGGDEFAVILPDCTEREAAAVIERMSSAMPEGHGFSAGVARWDRSEDPSTTIARADAALYTAKDAGRGRVMLSSELHTPGDELSEFPRSA